MARRRFQDPKPEKHGDHWTIRVWQDEFENGRYHRYQKRVKLAKLADTSAREAQRLAAEYLRPMNQGLQTIGSAVNFQTYVDKTYEPLVMPLLAQSTQDRYQGVIDNYLIPEFGPLHLRDLTPLRLQTYFSGMADWKLLDESRDKIRDVLASILVSAKQYGLIVTNPTEGLRLPKSRMGKRRSKPYLTPEQFVLLLARIPEPYATADTGCASKIGKITGLRKQADFLLVFPTRKLEQPAYEAKQMTTAKTVGAASRNPRTWAAMDWQTAQRNVRRLQVRIVQVTNVTASRPEAFERLELCELETLPHSS
jgi:integrase-like protein